MKFKVTKDKIEFSDIVGKIIIPAGAEIKFVFYRWDTTGPRGGYGRTIHSVAEILASKGKIKNRLPFLKRTPNRPHFDYYKEVKNFIQEIKKQNFPLGLDIYKLEKILSKPITEHTIFSKDGISHFPEPSDKEIEYFTKHGIKIFLIVISVTMLLILLMTVL